MTGLEELVTAPSHHRPTYLAPDLAGLLQAHAVPTCEDGTWRSGGWTGEVTDGRLDVSGAGALLTFLGNSGTQYARNMAWHKSAFTLGCIDLEDVSQYGAWCARRQYEGLSLRVARQYTIATDTTPARVDILYGWASVYPELACQQVSA